MAFIVSQICINKGWSALHCTGVPGLSFERSLINTEKNTLSEQCTGDFSITWLSLPDISWRSLLTMKFHPYALFFVGFGPQIRSFLYFFLYL